MKATTTLDHMVTGVSHRFALLGDSHSRAQNEVYCGPTDLAGLAQIQGPQGG
jgi:hypothetical protein